MKEYVAVHLCGRCANINWPYGLSDRLDSNAGQHYKVKLGKLIDLSLILMACGALVDLPQPSRY